MAGESLHAILPHPDHSLSFAGDDRMSLVTGPTPEGEPPSESLPPHPDHSLSLAGDDRMSLVTGPTPEGEPPSESLPAHREQEN